MLADGQPGHAVSTNPGYSPVKYLSPLRSKKVDTASILPYQPCFLVNRDGIYVELDAGPLLAVVLAYSMM